MRTLIDISQTLADSLAVICKKFSISRAEAIRRALGMFINENRTPTNNQAFGSWKKSKRQTDAYLKKIKSEWD
jgi:metal-responsive CopG/Arc/MetJ family transcriptional regulator